MNILDSMKRSVMSSSIIYIVLGLVMIIIPGVVNDFFSTIIGVFFLFTGVSQLASYSSKKSYAAGASANLIIGLAMTIFGIYIFLNPKFITSIIPIIAGIIILVNAINKVKQSIEYKTAKYSKWWINLISAVIVGIFGFILISNPFSTVEWLIRFLGFILLVDGLYNMVIMNNCVRSIKKVVKTIK